jgi:ABC-type lipoprotein export system ATPase subunit
MSVLKTVSLSKVYGGERGSTSVKALDSFSFQANEGEFIGIMGPSGSGKTTLLNLLGAIDKPTSGEIIIDGKKLSSIEGKELALFRRRRLGFVFQEYNLVDALTIKDNILLPLALEKVSVDEIEKRVTAMAQNLGIASVLSHFPYEVSGGEKQRAAAARALIHHPALVLADEPTGNLDSKSARILMESLEYMNREEKTTIVMVTHDPVSASYCRRIVVIKDGRALTELRSGGDRRKFFQQILDTLAGMGGENYDPTYSFR